MNIYLMKKPKRLNAVSATLLLIMIGLGYLGWAFGPIYWPIFQMTGIMRGICNDAYRERNPDKLMDKLVREAVRTKLKITRENFLITRTEFSNDEIQAAPEGARKLMLSRGRECVIDFHYEDDYTLPILNHTRRMYFDKRVVTAMEQVSWKKEDQLCTCVTIPPSR